MSVQSPETSSMRTRDGVLSTPISIGPPVEQHFILGGKDQL